MLLGAGLPAALHRKVTACARVQGASGEKVVAEVPPVDVERPFFYVKYDDTRIVGAHCTKQSVGIIVEGFCPNIIRI